MITACLLARPLDGVLLELPVEPAPARPESNAAGWALLVIVVGILVVELWLIGTGRKTMSEWVKGKTRGLPWWKAFGIAAIGLILFHLFEGGPL